MGGQIIQPFASIDCWIIGVPKSTVGMKASSGGRKSASTYSCRGGKKSAPLYETRIGRSLAMNSANSESPKRMRKMTSDLVPRRFFLKFAQRRLLIGDSA